jgi:probable F420-dependent oxidoreductase
VKIRFAIAAGARDVESFGREVTRIESTGFDTVWLSDIPLGPTIDPLVGLAFAAGATSTLKLGANVVPLGRNPLVLAKSLAQIDRLSAGRLLLSFVVGINQPGERQALGTEDANRGELVEELAPLLRSWWAGDAVNHQWGPYTFKDLASPARSVQQPLEVWFGGSGPVALARAGRAADGWLGSFLTPSEAGAARQRIQSAADAAGRTIDPEHFGLSLPYAPAAPDRRTVDLLQARRPGAELTALVPVGPDGLRRLVDEHVDAGLSKFVVRPVGPGADDEGMLEALAGILLPLQT